MNLDAMYRHLQSCGLVEECSADQAQMLQEIEYISLDY